MVQSINKTVLWNCLPAAGRELLLRAEPFIVPEEVARGGLLPSSPPDKRNVVLLDFLRSPLFLCNSAGRRTTRDYCNFVKVDKTFL